MANEVKEECDYHQNFWTEDILSTLQFLYIAFTLVKQSVCLQPVLKDARAQWITSGTLMQSIRNTGEPSWGLSGIYTMELLGGY